MTVTITNNLTLITKCDSATGWSSGAATTTVYREATGCMSLAVSNTTAHSTFTYSADLSNRVIYVWFKADAIIDTQANGGFRIGVTDGSHGRAYYVGGSDNYGFQVGGWTCMLLDTSNLPTAYAQVVGSAEPNFASATGVIVGFKTLSKSIGTTVNCFWDVLRHGSNSGYALTVGGGGVGTEGTWAEIAADDASTASGKAYGIVRALQTGVYGVQGALQFGNSGTSSSYFEDKNTIVVFENRLVNTSYYKIDLIGNSTGTNYFILGEKSGLVGVSGCTILSAGAAKISMELSHANFDTVGLYGCTLTDVGTVTLPATATGKEMLSCNINVSSEVLADTCKVQYCTFVASDSRAIRMSSISHNISDCDFINCPHGVHIPNTGTYTFDALMFTGEDGSTIYAIENSSAGLVTVNATNGANPAYVDNTGGGSTVINNAVSLKITTLDPDGGPISNARVLLEAANDLGPVPYRESVSITRSGSTATVSHTSHGLVTDNKVVIRGCNEHEYNGIYFITKIDDNSYSYTVSGTPASPATGSPTSTMAFMHDLTDLNGIVVRSYNFTATQDYIGKSRKASSAPFYRDATFYGTITADGIDIPVQMELDE